ncbi:MAG: DNA polymerase [Mycobacteriales bacterium]
MLAVVVRGSAVGLAAPGRAWQGTLDEVAASTERLVVWRAGATPLLPLRPRQVWDLAAVHKVLYGGRRDDPSAVWSAVHGLPSPARADDFALLDSALAAVEPYAGPIRSDGSLHPDSWRFAAVEELASLALVVQAKQSEALLALPDPRPVPSGPHLRLVTAWAESAAALLCVEMENDGLPFDRDGGIALITQLIQAADREARDAPVLELFRGDEVDLRNPASVRDALHRKGIEVPDTRSWRLEAFRTAHPVVEALLAWRKAERVATTYGYDWVEAQVRDGRLRGEWSAADGGAGRMTASAGLHWLPSELRSAIAAEPGHVLVRADLGQVEPRVLAAVSGDRAFAAAAAQDDLYTPVAAMLGVDRPTAKVAVLAAMYGQTSGAAGQALKQMESTYPTALAFLRAAEESGRLGNDLRTHGGRLILVGNGGVGRYARNAVVQGAAAELFKAWAAAVRNGLRGGRVVLCLHDELLLHVPAEEADDAVQLLHQALESTSAHWASGSGVRFVADVAVVQRWSDAKG